MQRNGGSDARQLVQRQPHGGDALDGLIGDETEHGHHAKHATVLGVDVAVDLSQALLLRDADDGVRELESQPAALELVVDDGRELTTADK